MKALSDRLAACFGGRAAAYDFFCVPLDNAGLAAVRARLAGDLCGSVLEVGCGTGLNFAHYPAGGVVTAIEPSAHYRVRAAERAAGAPARISVVEGDVQCLPFADHSFDAALVTLVFCSVPDPSLGLSELRRVLRPGAVARFLEHVRSPGPLAAFAQDLLNPAWSRMAEGCNLNRDTVPLVARAGFRIERVVSHRIGPRVVPSLPMREIHCTA